MRRVLIASVVLPLLASCSNPISPVSEVAVTVTELRDDAPGGAPDVFFQVENRSSRPLYITMCGKRVLVVVDRYQDVWALYDRGSCDDVLLNQSLLAPGEQISDSTTIHNVGEFRLRVGVALNLGAAPVWSATEGFALD